MFDADNSANAQWEPIPMVSAELKALGIEGGEGGQRMTALAASTDGSLMLTGTDVAGMWRSTDGGAHWQMVYGGFYARGCFSIAVDPGNKQRVLAFGSFPTQSAQVRQGNTTNGLYLSEDGGETWRFVLQQKGAAVQLDFRESIAFDPSSYDESQGRCMVAYWSRPWELQDMPSAQAPYYTGGEIQTFAENAYDNRLLPYTPDRNCLWKTTDGGENWQPVCAAMTDGIVKVHPTNGAVYVANLSGFHRSIDGGRSFQTVLGGRMIYGLDVINTHPDRVYINDTEGVWLSEDAGVSFTKITAAGFPDSYDPTTPDGIVRNLKVSPVNPQHMVLASHGIFHRYQSEKYYSGDGGSTWRKSSYSNAYDFFKANNRDTCFLWHPTDENKLWAFGGDWLVSSSDGGGVYRWDYNGGSAVYMDGRAAFNLYNPDLFYYGAQDFHGALTKDGGETWKHMWKWSRATGQPGTGQGYGSVYGAYAADEDTMVAIAAVGVWSSERRIFMSYDGGEEWTDTGVVVSKNKGNKWAELCYQSPNQPDILFAGNFRSTDKGRTWTALSQGVNLVYCHNPYGRKELYGSDDEGYIVVSYDEGESWERVIRAKSSPGAEHVSISDMAYDGVNDIIYYISVDSASRLFFCRVRDGMTENLTGNLNRSSMGDYFQLCTVDPRYPNVVYVGGYAGVYTQENAVQRSVDGGRTFHVLTVNGKENSVVRGRVGGLQAYELLVHPNTGELWVSNGGRGWMKLPPPYAPAIV